MIHTARNINDQKPKWVVGKVIKEINKILTSSKKLSPRKLLLHVLAYHLNQISMI